MKPVDSPRSMDDWDAVTTRFAFSRFTCPASRARLSLPGRPLMLIAILGALLLPARPADGGEANGIYKPTSLDGYFRFAGRKYELPLGQLRETLVTKGLVPVQANRMPLRVDKWGDVLERINLFGINGKAKARGPSNIVFRKVGERHVGRTPQPVVAKVRGKYKILPIWVEMSSRFETTITGDKLVVNSPLRLSVRGLDLSGRIRMTAVRQQIPVPGGR